MLDRTIAPSASTISRPNLPIPEIYKLGDIPVTVLGNTEQPVVLFEIVFPLGKWEEPKAGMSFLFAKMLQEGTSKHTAEDIAELLDFHGSFLEISPSMDSVSIKLYTLNRFFPKLLDLLVNLLTESVFPEREFQTLQQIRLEQVKQQHARNDAFANFKFREMLFGANHPYGKMMTGELVKAVSREELLSFSQMALTTPSIFITGQIGDAEISLVKKAFDSIPFLPSREIGNASISQMESQKIVREKSTQASLRVGMLSIDRKHEDIHKMKIANELLGGFFGSRLMKNIREEKGLTYGIHSSMIHLKHSSYWAVGSEVLSDKTDLALGEIQKEIQKLKHEPPADAEFSMVINYMKGKFLGSFGSPFSAHEMVKGLSIAGLNSNYFVDFLNTLDTIEPQDVSEMVKKHISTDRMIQLEVC